MMGLIIRDAHRRNPQPLPAIEFLDGDYAGQPRSELDQVVGDPNADQFLCRLESGGLQQSSFCEAVPELFLYGGFHRERAISLQTFRDIAAS